MRTLRWRFFAQISAIVALAACGQGAQQPPFPDALARQALVTYADIAAAVYADSLREARELERVVGDLVAQPSPESLERAKAQWLKARVPYRESEVYRFYEGPIDQVELLVNTWPIDESYVEAAATEPARGIVDDHVRYPELSEALLVSLNAQAGETSISTGYHVIEFLLWGRDVSETGPGARPYTDYVAGADGSSQRRGRYLVLATQLLAGHLESVARAWSSAESGNYRAQFLAKPPREALLLALRGMGALSGPELSGERLTVALETRDQENEHSCFSDSTRDDVVGNARGVENVCRGRYRSAGGASVQGVGLCQVFERWQVGRGRALERAIAAGLAATEKIPAPFDRALGGSDEAPGRKAIRGAIDGLAAQTRTIEEALGLLTAPSARPAP
jgi:putative iron-regulated protein